MSIFFWIAFVIIALSFCWTFWELIKSATAGQAQQIVIDELRLDLQLLRMERARLLCELKRVKNDLRG